MLQIVTASFFILSCLIIPEICALNCSSPLQVDPDECCKSVPQYVSKPLLNECKLNGKDECEPFNCVLRKKLLLTVDNKLDKIAIKKYVVKDQAGDWLPSIEATLQTCIDIADGNGCEARAFVGCFTHNLYKNCPPSAWTNSNNCKSVKEFLQQCKPIVT